MTIERIMTRLSIAPVQRISLCDIIAIDDLQKRRPEAMDDKSKAIDEQRRAELIKDIACSLKDDKIFESTPLRVVRCVPDQHEDPFGYVETFKAGNYLVDGFHRYQAYLVADRETVPVQIVEGTWEEAHEAASAMNNHTKTVGVDRQQRLQQAWEMVNSVFDKDQSGLKKGWSARRIANLVGVSRQTVDNMVRKVDEYGATATSLSWAEAKANASPKEISEQQRMIYIVRQAIELAEKSKGHHELDLMLRVLRDCRDDVLGYDPDLYDYVEKLLEEDLKVEEF